MNLVNLIVLFLMFEFLKMVSEFVIRSVFGFLVDGLSGRVVMF